MACDDLAHHHDRRKRDDPQGAPRILAMRRAQEDVIVLESVDVARLCHGWLYFTYRRMTVISSSAPFFRSASDRPGLATCRSEEHPSELTTLRSLVIASVSLKKKT